MLALVMSVVAVVASLIATRHGSALAPDSMTYISTARNLAHGRGLTDFTGHRLVVFGPGLPVLLAGGELVGIGALTGARLVNAAAFGLIVVLTFVLLRRHVKNRTVLLGATALVMLSTSLLKVVGFVVSDPPFLVVTLCFLLVIDTWKPGTGWRPGSVIVAAMLVWVAFMLRYAGAALLVAGVIALALASSKSSRRAVVAHVLAFAGLASLVPLAWVLRNLDVPPGEPLGLRVHSGSGPLGIAEDLLHGAVHLVVPDRIPSAIGLVALSAIAALIGTLGWRSRSRFAPVLRADGASVVPIATFVVVYVVFAIVARKTTGSDLDARILMPAWIPMLVVLAWFVDRLLRVERGPGLRRSLLVLMAIGLVGSSVWFVRQVDAGVAVVGYEPSSPDDVAMARALGDVPRSTLVVTNDPWRIYAATERQPVELAPIELLPGSSQRPMTVAALTNAVCRQRVVLVWFARSPLIGTRSIGTFERRATTVSLVRLRRFPKGASYELAPAGRCGQLHR